MISAKQAFDRVAGLSGVARENALLDLVAEGAIASHALAWRLVSSHMIDRDGHDHEAVLRVASDFVCFGEAAAPFYPGWMPSSVQLLADITGTVPATPKIVDLIRSAADVRLSIHGQPLATMTTSDAYRAHSDAVNEERRGRFGLLEGHQKTVVLAGDADHVAIYGAAWPDDAANGWRLVQGLNQTSHENTYVDYSHGARLVWHRCEVDGRAMELADLLADPVLWPLVSKVGPLASARMPQRAPSGLGSARVAAVDAADGTAGAAVPGLMLAGNLGAEEGIMRRPQAGALALGAVGATVAAAVAVGASRRGIS